MQGYRATTVKGHLVLNETPSETEATPSPPKTPRPAENASKPQDPPRPYRHRQKPSRLILNETPINPKL